ncbi:N-glycosylase/DNA lyase [Candidatus Woesearchaeota archaeon]|nr:N-glycosylase/DNA lyase [Candidatus Woesearchaeota archaeon]
MDIERLREEYSVKKDRIKERLDQFGKFFNEPYSWHYAGNEMKLLPSGKNDDERIFEELSFCICTANASAEMGLRSIDAIRNIIYAENAERISERLKGVHRFSNARAAYIVHTREYLKNIIGFRLKNKILSFRDKNELRDFFALNKDIKGLAYKEASHFLRNIGFKGYAILDKHIINSLHEFGVLSTNDKPKNARNYLEIEQKFIDFSKQVGIGMDELDLLLWSRKNGRILK